MPDPATSLCGEAESSYGMHREVFGGALSPLLPPTAPTRDDGGDLLDPARRRPDLASTTGSGKRATSSSERTRQRCRSGEWNDDMWMGTAGPWMGLADLSMGFSSFFSCLIYEDGQNNRIR